MSNSLRPHGLHSPRDSPGQNTGVGSLSLLQGIFPTQGLNTSLPHCRRILYQLNHPGNPRILEWVAYPFSSRSFWPRNWTRVFCITGRFFTNWATREVQVTLKLTIICQILCYMTLGLFWPCLCFLCCFSPFSSFQLIQFGKFSFVFFNKVVIS